MGAFSDEDGVTWRTSGSLLVHLRIARVAIAPLIPTLLMAGTPPGFSRQFVVARSGIATEIGFPYGTNTLGADPSAAACGPLSTAEPRFSAIPASGRCFAVP